VVFTLRKQSHAAGYLRPLGRDENILPIHDEVGRSTDVRKAITESPLTRELIRATKMGTQNSIKIQNQNKIAVNSYNFSVD